MLEILCNGNRTPWKEDLMTLPTITGESIQLRTYALDNEEGYFSYTPILVKGFVFTYYVFQPRRAVTFDFVRSGPQPEIFTSALRPSVFIRSTPITNDRDIAGFMVGFRSRQKTSVHLVGRMKYAWCTIALPLHFLQMTYRFFYAGNPLFPGLLAWSHSEFGLVPPHIPASPAMLSGLRSVLYLPLEGAVREEYQFTMLNAFCQNVLFRMGNSRMRLGTLPSGFPHEKEIVKAASILDANVASSPSVTALAKRVGTNQTTLRKGFLAVFGINVRQYVMNRKLETALTLLRRPGLTEADIAEQAGYGTAAALVKAFRRELGGTPGSFKMPEEISFGITTM